MNEEPTKDLPNQLTFEERVFAEFASLHREVAAVHAEIGVLKADVSTLKADVSTLKADVNTLKADVAIMKRDIASLDGRLTRLEEKVELRLYDTRPIWEAVQLQIARLDQKFDIVIKELYEVRADTALHDKRLTEVERRLNS